MPVLELTKYHKSTRDLRNAASAAQITRAQEPDPMFQDDHAPRTLDAFRCRVVNREDLEPGDKFCRVRPSLSSDAEGTLFRLTSPLPDGEYLFCGDHDYPDQVVQVWEYEPGFAGDEPDGSADEIVTLRTMLELSNATILRMAEENRALKIALAAADPGMAAAIGVRKSRFTALTDQELADTYGRAA